LLVLHAVSAATSTTVPASRPSRLPTGRNRHDPASESDAMSCLPHPVAPPDKCRPKADNPPASWRPCIGGSTEKTRAQNANRPPMPKKCARAGKLLKGFHGVAPDCPTTADKSL